MRLRTRILIDAKQLIADPHLWGQGSMESTDDPPRRCLSGAICAATGIPEHQISDNPVTADVIALVARCIQNRTDGRAKLDKFMTAEDIEHCPPGDTDWLAAFNDHSDHPTVIALLDDAIGLYTDKKGGICLARTNSGVKYTQTGMKSGVTGVIGRSV